jgi:SanA protein
MNSNQILIKLYKTGLVLSLVTILAILISNYWIISFGKKYSYAFVKDVEPKELALVLGTSKSVNGIHENPFFYYRMRAAAELYHSGKVKHILVSGDNSNKAYNEPLDMKKRLMKLGVPEHAITMDFAGRRTLDSVVRCKEIFQKKSVIIISQEFHNYRALFIARFYGMDAIGFSAKYPNQVSSKTLLREYFARPKAILDLYILKTSPQIMGEKIKISV